MRGRSYSYSPSPPRGYSRRRRSPSPRGRYGGRGRDLPTSPLVRNLRHNCRPEDLRGPFGHFGPLKDIYLPRDYYTGEPRGFGFVQFVDPADAKYHMDGQILLGREVTVVFAEENRKKPSEMRARDRVRVGHTIADGLPLVILDHCNMLEPALEVLITIHLLLGGGGTQGQCHLETEVTGSNCTQDLPMVQGAVAAALAGAGVEAWTTLSSGTL